ncbi:MAG TPA: choice-of-anchor Q domain-containing protein [Candidatus Binatia bacterium]|nr:choice-of-anchor Q domain-containing protein [Candidatus Binatia bacterium]
MSNTSDAGGGSLRAALIAANANPGLDQIVFDAGGSGTITLASSLSVTDDLTINGPGARVVTVTGSNARRIFDVTAPTTISGLRLANGFADRGAGIRFDDPGLLTISDCHFDQHLVTVDGGAIILLQGSLVAERSSFTTDQAAGNGGVIAYGEGGGTPSVTITNCTFVNNFASNSGGAIRQGNTTAYTAAVTNCTFVVNNAGSGGGAIAVNGGTMSLMNNLFTANGAGGNPGGHVHENGGTFVSLGHNLFGHLSGTTFVPDVSDRFGSVAAQLNTGVLIAFPSNNGGATDTLAVSATSIAIDAGGATGAPPTDQRDFPRVGCAPDIGAFEVQTLTDTDVDGVINCLDTCPATPTCASVDQGGCPTDSDDDGVSDGCDSCPGTRNETVDSNGCATDDEDGDGILNDADRCRGTQPCAAATVDPFGCPTDADEDGVFDGCDFCPGEDDLTDTDDDDVPDCLTTTSTTSTTTTTTTTLSTTTTTRPELLTGKKLLLKDKAGKPQKRALDVILAAPTLAGGNGSEDDPVLNGGALRVLSASGGFDATYQLPASGWKYQGAAGAGKGYKFTGSGAIRSVIVKPGKVARVIGKGSSLEHTLATNPAPVDVVLELGAQSYCGRFGGSPEFTQGIKYLAKSAPPPAECGSPSGAFLD